VERQRSEAGAEAADQDDGLHPPELEPELEPEPEPVGTVAVLLPPPVAEPPASAAPSDSMSAAELGASMSVEPFGT
jgi:hypothetical protein